MNLFASKVIEVRNVAGLLLWSFWNSRANPRRKKLPDTKSVENSAIREEDLPDRDVRRLLLILRNYLEGKQFTAEDNKVLLNCLNVRIKNMILICQLDNMRPTCVRFAKSRRNVAEHLVRFLDLLSIDERLVKEHTLGICSCGRVFLRKNKNQRHCQNRCRFLTWTSAHPDYWQKYEKETKRPTKKTHESERMKALAEYARSSAGLSQRSSGRMWKLWCGDYNKEFGKRFGRFTDVSSFEKSCREALNSSETTNLSSRPKK